ncbi:glycine oxidase ThiO [Microbulbifer sp. SSSA002]|uniref:glycine oxidase ThiO n=1 Tax=Microbulbifer sp. SSSA002 TaxID=3243376 RepID=UPI004039F76F
MTSASKAKIAIAGGGLLGRLLAWRLCQRELDITLFEAGDLSAAGEGACWTAAGMISPLSELAHCDKQVYTQGLKSLELWSEWSRQLEQQSGQQVEYRRAGSILVAHGKDRSELLQFLRELQGKLGESVREQVQPLDSRALANLEPALHSFEQGLYLRGEADIDNQRLLPALLSALRRGGVTLRENSRVSCEVGQISLPPQREQFDCVIDCRGLGAKGQIEGLRGVRGEVMVVESQEVVLQRPVRLLHPRYKLYAVPRSDGRTVIGATEIESEDLSPISVRSSMELSSALYSLNPAFAEARIIETRVNCRPATMDNMPYIHGEDGLIRVNGLYRHGYLLAPAVVAQVENQVAQQLLQVV